MRNEKLIKKREEKAFTQVQVAEKADISLRAYQKYEYGCARPHVGNALKIANVLNTTVESLF